MEMTKEQKEECLEGITQAIEIFGSQSKMARALGTSSGAVCNWMKGRKVPNAANAFLIHKVTRGKIKREKLRPDLFT